MWSNRGAAPFRTQGVGTLSACDARSSTLFTPSFGRVHGSVGGASSAAHAALLGVSFVILSHDSSRLQSEVAGQCLGILARFPFLCVRLEFSNCSSSHSEGRALSAFMLQLLWLLTASTPPSLDIPGRFPTGQGPQGRPASRGYARPRISIAPSTANNKQTSSFTCT